MPAAALAPIVLIIRGDSRIAKKLARACRRVGIDPLPFATAALETMLAAAMENPDTLDRLAWRARQKGLASQLKGG